MLEPLIYLTMLAAMAFLLWSEVHDLPPWWPLWGVIDWIREKL
jgi:hypothetical protein